MADSLEVIESQRKVVQQEIASSKIYADDVGRSVPEIQKELDNLTALRNKGLTRQIEVLSVQRYVSELQQQRQQSILTVTRSGRAWFGIVGGVLLGAIVLIRTFLSIALQLELEGRWPWQPREEAAGSAEHPPAAQ